MGKVIKAGLGVLAAVVLSACSGLSGKAGDSAALESRAEARWNLLVQGKVAEAYAYLSPAARDVTSLEEYVGGIKSGLWRSGTVTKVACAGEDELCTVSVDVKYVFKPRGAAVIESVRTVNETWRKVGGEWWFVPAE